MNSDRFYAFAFGAPAARRRVAMKRRLRLAGVAVPAGAQFSDLVTLCRQLSTSADVLERAS